MFSMCSGRLLVIILQVVIGTLLNSQVAYVCCSSSSRSSSKSTSNNLHYDFGSYENVRALDSSGHSVQLKNAEAAADVQGRLIIVIRRPENASVMIICATKKSINDDISIRSHIRSNYNNHDDDDDGLVQCITRRTVDIDHHNSQPQPTCSVYAVCTGVQSDAKWLIRELQLYARTIEERYGTNTPQAMAATAISMLKRSFWGYNNDIGWTGRGTSVLSINSREDDNESYSSSWARPMGVKTILITTTTAQVPLSSQQVLVQIIDPSGIVRTIDQVACIGQNSVLVQTELMKKLSGDTTSATTSRKNNNLDGYILQLPKSDEEVIRIVQDVVSDVFFSSNIDNDNDKPLSDSVHLQIETISATKGIVERRHR